MQEGIEILLEHNPFFVTDVEKLAKGGQKSVFLCNSAEYGRVVLKIVVCSTVTQYDRAIREIECSNKIKSSHIPNIYNYKDIEIGEEKVIYILEEYIKGQTLREILVERKIEGEEKVSEFGKELLRILSQVHNQNLVHRDVKPENIIISEHGEVYLLDLGIVRDLDNKSLTSDLAMFGPMTLGYAAPEQIQNEKYQICNRTDIYSWGVIMYELLNNENPFKKQGDSQSDVIIRMLKYTPTKLKLKDKLLGEIIQQSMQKSIHRRPKSCDVILNLLEGEGQ